MWERLDKRFQISTVQQERAVASIGGVALLDREAVSGFLAEYRQLIEGTDDTVAAAYFGSWFGSVAAAIHYTVSVHHAAPDFSTDNLQVCLIPESGYTRLVFRIVREEADWAPNDPAARAGWREDVLTRFYGLTVRPLMECLSAASGLHVGMIWGQLPTALNNYYERWQEEIRDEAILARLAEDIRLAQELPPHVFGRSKNPLQVNIRSLPHPLEPGKQLALKNVCCLQYLRQNRYFCYTCPRLTAKERAEWRH